MFPEYNNKGYLVLAVLARDASSLELLLMVIISCVFWVGGWGSILKKKDFFLLFI
jgi:hypothetical protein